MKKSIDDRMNYDENGYYMDELEEKERKSKGASPVEKILGIFLVVWFILSVGYMVYLSQTSHNDYKIPIVLFQLIMVFGIVITISTAIKNKKVLFLPILFIFIGLFGIIATSAYHNGSEADKSKIMKLVVILFLLSFVAVGIFIVVKMLMGMKGNAEKCTLAVTAKCISVSTSSVTVNGRTTVYYNPTYEYSYENETYNGYVSDVIEERIEGMNYDVMIDPDDPKTVYDPASKKSYAFVIIFGSMFIAMPLFMLICILKFIKF
jgi:4-amino-4-deoxy-L-arabinose transferase-like glycosyltransferase